MPARRYGHKSYKKTSSKYAKKDSKKDAYGADSYETYTKDSKKDAYGADSYETYTKTAKKVVMVEQKPVCTTVEAKPVAVCAKVRRGAALRRPLLAPLPRTHVRQGPCMHPARTRPAWAWAGAEPSLWCQAQHPGRGAAPWKRCSRLQQEGQAPDWSARCAPPPPLQGATMSGTVCVTGSKTADCPAGFKLAGAVCSKTTVVMVEGETTCECLAWPAAAHGCRSHHALPSCPPPFWCAAHVGVVRLQRGGAPAAATRACHRSWRLTQTCLLPWPPCRRGRGEARCRRLRRH